jgi:fumarylacetoacetase
MLDLTHDPQLRSWVEGSDFHPDFPIQNLPLCVFSPLAGAPRGGVAIGDCILDLRALHDADLLDDEAQAVCHVCTGPTLNAFLALGAGSRSALRDAVSTLLAEGSDRRPYLLHPAADCLLYMPAHVGDYTDFYAGIHHATNTGRLLRPDNPLLPNYKWVPVGYHGRASSVRVSGAEVRRPGGQRKRADEAEPSFGASRSLDCELELGVWIGPGNALGTPIPIGHAAEHIAGYCLLNDWSARDIQAWEYQPLGPLLAKSFATSISPWIVTPEALAPFRCPPPPRPEGDPRPLPYLWDNADQASGALDLEIEALLLTPAMRARGEAPFRLSQGTSRDLYWTPAQLVAHHASNGCNLQPGDLLGSGTISGTAPGSYGSLLELTRGGREPIGLPGGEERRFLEDGDEVILRARARREGFASIGLGECRGRVSPAL